MSHKISLHILLKRYSLGKKIKFFIKSLFTCIAFYIVFENISIQEVLKQTKALHVKYFIGALIFFNLSKIVSSIRLNSYLNTLNIPLSQVQNLKLYYIGMFYNLFLPGGIGGDGYKIYLLNKKFNIETKKLLLATLLDRLSGFVPLVFIGAFGIFFTPFIQLEPSLKIVSILTLTLIIPLSFVISKKLFTLFHHIFLKTLLMGFMVQFLQLLAAMFLLFSINSYEHTIIFLFLFLLSSIVAIFPISIGGAGVREVVFLYGATMAHCNIETGVTFAILFFIITAISSFFGLFLSNPIQK